MASQNGIDRIRFRLQFGKLEASLLGTDRAAYAIAGFPDDPDVKNEN